MGPVFIRRGGVLFVLKSPDDFLGHLKTGKIRPDDCILVKDQYGMEWLPVKEVAQFRIETNQGFNEEIGRKIINTENLFDHIRQPKFNFTALLAGGFWYFLHGMPGQGVKQFAWSLLTITGMLFGGFLLSFTALQLFILLPLAWFGTTLICALRADHDLNTLQVERFHQKKLQTDKIPVELLHATSGIADPSIPHIPSLHDKVLN